MRTSTFRTTRNSGRKSVRLAIAVPLVALGLSGLTACEFGSDDKDHVGKPTASATGSADAKGSDKPGDKPGDDDPKASGKPSGKDTGPAADVPSSDELADALLNAQEVPAGYTAGEADTTMDDGTLDPDSVVSDPRCETLLAGTSSQGKAERTFTKDTLDADDEEGVIVTLTSDDPDTLQKDFDKYAAALKACSSFRETNGNDSWDYEISEVRLGTHGQDSISYRATVMSEGDVRSHQYVMASRHGAVGVTVSAYSVSSPPDAPTRFTSGQIQKAEEIA
ncbi:hypothetical protein [Yinghuangia sp. YIM S09857]|uniref:hypothetical protein n=1 Tax=Yinghuangia sp. YIM S09857 TaxID=3436929 RepID=UPI003F536ACB